MNELIAFDAFTDVKNFQKTIARADSPKQVSFLYINCSYLASFTGMDSIMKTWRFVATNPAEYRGPVKFCKRKKNRAFSQGWL